MILDQIDFDAWSSGQIGSKLWLCETLENLIDTPVEISILGGWYGILSFLFFSRNNIKINRIDSYDINPSCQEISYRINKLWEIEGKFHSHIMDINSITKYSDVVINTSTEHIHGNQWFENIPSEKIVVIQSTNQKHEDHFFCVENLSELEQRYPLKTWFLGEKEFVYPMHSFKRFMIIGTKE